MHNPNPEPLTSTPEALLVNVFGDGARGGNPAPIVVDATGMTDAQMQDVARRYGHESGFVLPAPESSGCDVALRFWVPNHEMNMCGHATVGAVWLLGSLGVFQPQRLSIATPSGVVSAMLRGTNDADRIVEISQPPGRVEVIEDHATQRHLLATLGVDRDDLASAPIQNAATSRVKTLVPLADAAALDRLEPDLDEMRPLCDRLGSTGIYPYARHADDERLVDARQFPRASGYPEDAATGIAATALCVGMLHSGQLKPTDGPIVVRQGRAMGRPSRMTVRFELHGGRVTGCWLGGSVHPATEPMPA